MAQATKGGKLYNVNPVLNQWYGHLLLSVSCSAGQPHCTLHSYALTKLVVHYSD